MRITPKRSKQAKPLTVAASNDGRRTVVLTVDHGEWVVHCAFVQQEGQPALASLHVAPRGEVPAGGLTSRFLRTILPGDLLLEARRRLTEYTSQSAADMASFVAREPRRGRHRRRSDLECALLAWRYVQACAESKKPILRLAEQLNMDRDQLRGVVNDLRRRDFLTPGQQGRPGGSLTEKSKAILATSKTDAPAARARRPGRATPRA